MIVRPLLAGLRSAVREWRLVLILWVWHLTLALLVAVPLYVWLSRVLGLSPEARETTLRFAPTVLADVLERDASTLTTLLWTAAVVGALAAIGTLFVGGGLLHVLVSRQVPARAEPAVQPAADSDGDGVPNIGGGRRVDAVRLGTLRTFLGGAGSFFWRNLRLFFMTSIPAAAGTGIVVALLRLAVKPLEGTTSELGDWVRMLLPLAAVALGVLLFLLVFDYGRIALVATDDRRARVACWMGTRFVYRHAGWAVLLWLVLFLLGALGFGVFLLLSSPLNGTSWAFIVLLVILQQGFVLWRATLRVALGAGQIEQALARGLPLGEKVQ